MGRMVHATKRPKVNLVRTKNNDALKDEIVVPRGTLVTCLARIELQFEMLVLLFNFWSFFTHLAR